MESTEVLQAVYNPIPSICRERQIQRTSSLHDFLHFDYVKDAFEINSIHRPPAFEIHNGVLILVNYRLGEIPITGNSGTQSMLFTGAAFMLIAGIWIIYKKKTRKEKI